MAASRVRGLLAAGGLALALPAFAAPLAGATEAAAIRCGFITIQGLVLRPETVSCEPSNRRGTGYLGMTSLDGASFSGRLAAIAGAAADNDAHLEIRAERDTAGISGFKHITDVSIRAFAKKSGEGFAGRDFSDVEAAPFRHVTFTIHDNGDWACAWGAIESSGRVWGTGEVRAYAFVQYCERGRRRVSGETLREIANALKLD